MYERVIKRLLDIVLSLAGIAVLAVPMLIISLAIKLGSPGPVFFRQKRFGIHKSFFNILKFRTMRTDTPKDVPTHMLADPTKWITRTGAFLRGPRPALWNQDDLIAERDRYGANDVKPGLTGWAQINGRDELPIDVKAKLDGEYVKKLSFGFDCKCFFGTVKSVLRHEGVVEGGTGELEREKGL